MKRVIIVHRWEANSNSDWYQWLKTELEKLGCEVLIPEMPDTDVPVIEKWVSGLSKVVGVPDENTYFIGHSIGCQTILRYLERVEGVVGGAVFVAGWFNLKNLESRETDEIAKPWIETAISFDNVKKVLKKSTLIISNNDPFDCFEENEQKFNNIINKCIVLPNAGHITAEDGFVELPVVLEELKSFLE